MSDLRARLLEACKLQTLEKIGVPGVTGVTEPAERPPEPKRYAQYACYASDESYRIGDEEQRKRLPHSDSRDWDAADWHAYFDERAAIREHDGRLDRREAEELAFVDLVGRWLWLHPAFASDPRQGCAHCGLGDQFSNPVLPFLPSDGHVWVHDQSWDGLRTARRHHAQEAPRARGVVGPICSARCNNGNSE